MKGYYEYMNKTKRNISLLLLAFSLLLTGCISEEDRQQAAKWREQAEKNAVEYVKDKYGFDAQVLSSETQKVEGLFSATLTSKTLVKLEYEGKEFGVLSYGEDEYMDKASDNYQKDIIVESYKEEVCKLFEVEPDNFEVVGGENFSSQSVNGDEFYDMYFHEYFDGENLEEVLMEYQLYCLAEYVDSENYSMRFMYDAEE